MNERDKSLAVGIFIVVALAMTAWLLLFLKPKAGDGQKELRVRFTNVEKVNLGTRVTYAGKPVGEVKEICLIPKARLNPPDQYGDYYLYELLLKVDSSVEVFQGDLIGFSTFGLLGEKAINITPKAPKEGVIVHEITETIIYANSHDKLEEALTSMITLSKSIHRFVDEEMCGATSSFRQASDAVNRVFEQALEVNLIPSMGATFANLQCVSSQLASGQGTLGKMLYDDNLFYQMEWTLSQLSTTLHYINQYGLFFQFSSGWAKEKRMRNQ